MPIHQLDWRTTIVHVCACLFFFFFLHTIDRTVRPFQHGTFRNICCISKRFPPTYRMIIPRKSIIPWRWLTYKLLHLETQFSSQQRNEGWSSSWYRKMNSWALITCINLVRKQSTLWAPFRTSWKCCSYNYITIQSGVPTISSHGSTLVYLRMHLLSGGKIFLGWSSWLAGYLDRLPKIVTNIVLPRNGCHNIIYCYSCSIEAQVLVDAIQCVLR